MVCHKFIALQEELSAKERQEDIRRINPAQNELEITNTLLNQTKEDAVF